MPIGNLDSCDRSDIFGSQRQSGIYRGSSKPFHSSYLSVECNHSHTIWHLHSSSNDFLTNACSSSQQSGC